MKMNIYDLERTDPIGWDEYSGMVIIASTPEQARQIAIEEADIWPNERVTCKRIGTSLPEETKPRIVLANFNAG